MIFLHGNVPSSKNSKVKTAKGVFMSKTCSKYLQNIGVKNYHMRDKTIDEYKKRPNLFKLSVGNYFDDVNVFPVKIGFHFVRDSKRKFDFHNIVQIIADLMVCHRFIPDDDMSCFLPFPMQNEIGEWYTVDKNKPGVYIKILN